MKNKFKPTNQLFLFSNKLDPRIETWFSGSVIIEQNFPRNESSCVELEKLANLVSALNIGNYKYVTNVINYKTSNLLMVKISGIYPVMCSLTTKSDYMALNRIYKTFEAWIERSSVLDDFISNEYQLLISLRGSNPLRKLAYKNEKEIIESLKKNDVAVRDLLAMEFRSNLTI